VHKSTVNVGRGLCIHPILQYIYSILNGRLSMIATNLNRTSWVRDTFCDEGLWKFFVIKPGPRMSTDTLQILIGRVELGKVVDKSCGSSYSNKKTLLVAEKIKVERKRRRRMVRMANEKRQREEKQLKRAKFAIWQDPLYS
jgi:hypothetical protein